MPRKKKDEVVEERREERQKARRRSAAPRARAAAPSGQEIESMASSLSSKLVSALGLDSIGLTANDIKDLVASAVSSMSEGRSTKLTEDVALKRLLAVKDNLLKAIAAKLLSSGAELDRGRLEFVVTYFPEGAGKAAPYLYQVARKLGADDIIATLRPLWAQYGRPTPVRCPRCGFLAVTPDLTCLVCGAQLSEGEIKRDLGFPNTLVAVARRLHPRLVEEMIGAGYVVVDGDVNPPSLGPQSGFRLVLHLSREEKELLKKVLEERSGQQAAGPQTGR